MKRRDFANRFRIAALIFLVLLTSYLLIFIPPTQIPVIAGFIACISLLVFYSVSYVTEKNLYRILASLFIAAFLMMNFFAGFNILNTILLLSFIIGLGVLLQ